MPRNYFPILLLLSMVDGSVRRTPQRSDSTSLPLTRTVHTVPSAFARCLAKRRNLLSSESSTTVETSRQSQRRRRSVRCFLNFQARSSSHHNRRPTADVAMSRASYDDTSVQGDDDNSREDTTAPSSIGTASSDSRDNIFPQV